MFTKIAKWVTGHPKKILFFWILILVAGGYFAIKLPNELSSGGFNDPKSESMIEKNILQKEFSNKYPQNLIVVVQHKSKTVSDKDYEKIVGEIKNKLNGFSQIKEVTTYYEHKNKHFVSKDKSTTYIAVGLSATEDQAASLVPKVESKLGSINLKNFNVKVTGGPALNYALNNATKESVSKAEMIAIPVMIIVLLFVFRTVFSAVLPLAMAMFALTGTMATVYFIAQNFSLNTLVTNIISMIGLGVAVDYSLFIVSRYRNELERSSVIEAVLKTMETAGRSVLYSGLTVAISLSALFIPNIMIFNSIALGGVIVVFFSILVSITLLPALLTMMGTRVNKWRIPLFNRRNKTNIWERLANTLIKHPVVFLIPSLFILLIIAVPAIKTNMQVPVASASSIPNDSPEREGFEMLINKFDQGDVFPIEIVLKSQHGKIIDKSNLETVNRITNEVSKLDHVDKVTSITNWNNEWKLEDYEGAYKNFNLFSGTLKEQLENLLNADNGKDTTVILVASDKAADSKISHNLVKDIRETVKKNNTNHLTTYVGGETATGVDFDHKVFESIPIMILTVFIVSFFVLVITFKSIIIPIKAIVLNTLVTLASIGVLVFAFQNKFSLNFDPNQTINSITPVVLFTVLFGLSMDYEVIIISRMKEFFEEGLSHDNSIVKGLSDTAGLVNGAAIIMIAVFGAFSLVNVRVVAEMGLGLAFAILVDALLVRTILIPILMKLFGELNWWTPFKKKGTLKTKVPHESLPVRGGTNS
ncbi:MAG: MMPL family transporter [Thermoanaerobacterium sp.]|nr:MMPL family transporter [Thermoanaerobacterium sp.]